MTEIKDKSAHVAEQYRNSENLDARIALHQRFGADTYGWQHWLFDQWHLPEKCRILELGCGTGLFWRENQTRIPKGWDVTLTDLSEGMVETAERNLHETGLSFSYQVADAGSLPFSDASFDAVIANHMLYHVPNRPAAFKEVNRVLKPGGQFYASTNGLGHMRELKELESHFELPGRLAFQTGSFCLENGAGQLGEWFDDVNLSIWDNSGLRVTETEPLIAYILSMHANVSEETTAAMREYIDSELRETGVFLISRDCGVFTATARK